MITDRKLCRNLPERISAACNAGIKAVLLREKDLSRNDYQKLAIKIRSITKKTKSKLIMYSNPYPEKFAGAEAIHFPEMELLRLKRKSRYKILAGVSVHSAENAVKAEKMGFDYILFGPVYRTPSKIKYGKPMGLSKLNEVCNSVKIPVFAVGGINPSRALKCKEKGAHGAAVIRDLLLSDNIKKTLRNYKRALGSL